MSKQEQPKVAPRKEYTLTAPHTHQGEDLVPGDKVQLTARQAELIKAKLKEGVNNG